MKKNILIIGTGSIALRHLKNILSIVPKSKIFLFSHDNKRAINISKKLKTKVFAIKNFYKIFFSHVIIATSTIKHNKYLRLFFEKRANIYCEKPLPNDEDLVFLNKKKIRKKLENKVKIGYQLRFNPIIKYLVKELKKKENKKIYLIKFLCGQNLKDWRKDGNFSKLYSAGSSKYGSVYWELSHEIDLLNYLVGKPDSLFCSNINSKTFNMNVHDISNTIFNYGKKGLSCSISLEMLSPILYRKLIVVTKSNYFEADLINNFIIKKNKKNAFKKKFHISRNHIFIEFMKKFLQNKKYSDSFPFSRLKDALIVTKIIKTMINSNKQKKLINL